MNKTCLISCSTFSKTICTMRRRLEHDRDSLQRELLDAGFRRNEIGKAFDWLEAWVPLITMALCR